MLVRKASAWFPHFRELLRMDEFCRKIGFNDAQTETLIRGKSLKYSGTLYSEMHRKQFKAENVIARISPDETNGRKFILKIDGLPIVRWFREQAEKITTLYFIKAQYENVVDKPLWWSIPHQRG